MGGGGGIEARKETTLLEIKKGNSCLWHGDMPPPACRKDPWWKLIISPLRSGLKKLQLETIARCVLLPRTRSARSQAAAGFRGLRTNISWRMLSWAHGAVGGCNWRASGSASGAAVPHKRGAARLVLGQPCRAGPLEE